MITATITSRGEVLQHMEGFLKENIGTFLKSVEDQLAAVRLSAGLRAAIPFSMR